MIYTSYFARLKDIPEKYVPVSIALKTPEFYKGLTYKKLAPTKEILYQYKQDSDFDKYTEEFNSQILENRDVMEVLRDLLALTGSYDIVLLCYEKGTCHRHLVSKWLRDNGVKCEEYKF